MEMVSQRARDGASLRMTTTPIVLASVPDPEVPARAQRRQYSARYKARILGEYERLDTTEHGALLRREGLYSSHISKWRKQLRPGRPGGVSHARWPTDCPSSG